MAKQQPKTEVAIIPIELSPVLKDTKIETSKAQQHAMAFAPSMQDYIALSVVINDLDKVNPSEMDAKRAREARLKMVKVRTGAEEIKDLRKEGIKAEGDLIQALYNVVKNSCIVTETEFQEIEKHQERAEAKRQADIAETRTAELELYGADTSYLPLGIMGDEQYARCLESAKLAFDARRVRAEKEEAERLENIRLAELAEQERLRLQAERIEAERLEAIRIKEELAAKEAELQKEREDRDREYHANRKLKEDRFAARLPQLEKLGFTFDESRGYFDSPAWGMYWETCVNQDEQSWAENIAQINASIKELADKEAQLIAERKAAAAEAEKLAKENQAKLAEQKRLTDIENKKQAEILAAQKMELDKLAEASRILADREAKELAAKQAALLAPDKDKINQLYLALKNLEIPKFQTIEAATIGDYVKNQIAQLLEDIKFKSQKLK